MGRGRGKGRDHVERRTIEIKGEDFLSTIINSAPDGILLASEDGRILTANDAITSLLGYELQELLGENVSMLIPRPHRDVHDEYLQKFNQEKLSAIFRVRREVRGQKKDGSIIPLDLHVAPLEYHGIHFFIAVLSDISGRKELEAAQQQALEELQSKNDELEHLREAEHIANLAKSRFLANMSHEIRTPMTAILGFVDILLDPDLSVEQRKEIVVTIQRNGHHLLRVISDILDISKIEAGKLEVRREKVQFLPLIADVLSTFRVKAREKSIDLHVEYSGEIPRTLLTDPTRLKQILMNLIGNAIKFTDRGKVRLVVRFETPLLLTIEVIDTGIGLTEEEERRLFKPFSQASEGMNRRHGGTGLGLCISRNLARMLGGDLTVSSRLGSGSRFRLTIDPGKIEPSELLWNPDEVCTDPHEVSIDSTPASITESFPISVLIAEDGIDNQKLLAYLLKKMGVSTEIVENGRIALDKALSAQDSGRPFDLILMDMQMPEMDGYEATRKLRESGYKLPIVALTAHAMVGDRELCLAAGCDDYATKPIDRKRLALLIQKYASHGAAVTSSPLGSPAVQNSLQS